MAKQQAKTVNDRLTNGNGAPFGFQGKLSLIATLCEEPADSAPLQAQVGGAMEAKR